MTSRRNVNLNKELANDWQGWVRKWQKRWVPCEDKPPPGKKVLSLLKWVQTEDRAKPGPARHPHILPVKDLSLVPGSRLGSMDSVAVASRQVADPTAAPPLLDPAAAAAAVVPAEGSAQQLQLQPGAPEAAAAATMPPAQLQLLPPAVAEPPAAAAAAAVATASEITPSSISLDVVPNEFQEMMDAAMADAAAAAAVAGTAAAAAAAGVVGLGLPTPTGLVTDGLQYSMMSGQPGMVMAGGYGAVRAMPAASDYTGGTDSEALGRMPLGAVSDYTAGTDMDEDAMMGQSQGTASMQHTGDMIEEDEEDIDQDEVQDEDQDLGDEEDDEEDLGEEDDGLDEDGQEQDGDEDNLQNDDGLADDGYDDDDDEEDMPG